MLDINVLVSTIDAGIYKVGNVVKMQHNNVIYFVTHQYTSEEGPPIPSNLIRNDIFINQIRGRGLSVNRNISIRNANGDIGIFCDDDIVFTPDAFQIIRSIYESNEAVDVACFKIKTLDGEPDYKEYPAETYFLNRDRKHYISSVEITFRINKIKAHNILFDERFGAGSEKIPAAEEEAFIRDCITEKLNVVYYPYYIVIHPFESLNKHLPLYHKTRIWIAAALDARVSVKRAIFVALLRTYKLMTSLRNEPVNPISYFFQSFSAIWYIFRTTKKITKR